MSGLLERRDWVFAFAEVLARAHRHSPRRRVGFPTATLSIGFMKDIFALKLYTRVARLGSFSAAARECGLSQSQASRIRRESVAYIKELKHIRAPVQKIEAVINNTRATRNCW
jgi:hypothetical protein